MTSTLAHVSVALGLAGALAGCLTERDIPTAPARPRVTVDVKAPHRGAPCAAHAVDVVEGAVPAGMKRLSDVTTTAHEPWLTLKAHENIAKDIAARECADGLSVLSATESGKGVLDATMVFWRKPRDNEIVAVADAGPDDVSDIDVKVETGL